MAKEKFCRNKPHVNIGSISTLRRLGLTAAGAQQVLSGRLVTNLDDREIVADLLSTLVDQAHPNARLAGSGGFILGANNAQAGQATGKRQHMPIKTRHYY
jgi:hypothetical protein